MAEGLAKKILGNSYHIESAGLITPSWDNAAENAIRVMKEDFGIDISSHRPRNIASVNLEDFDRIVALDLYVGERLERDYPFIQEKLVTWEVEDPIGQDIEVYRRCAKAIEKLLMEISLNI